MLRQHPIEFRNLGEAAQLMQGYLWLTGPKIAFSTISALCDPFTTSINFGVCIIFLIPRVRPPKIILSGTFVSLRTRASKSGSIGETQVSLSNGVSGWLMPTWPFTPRPSICKSAPPRSVNLFSNNTASASKSSDTVVA